MKRKLIGIVAGTALLAATGCQNRGEEAAGGTGAQQQQAPRDESAGTGGAGLDPSTGRATPEGGSEGLHPSSEGTTMEEPLRPEAAESESWDRNSPQDADQGGSGFDVMQDDASPADHDGQTDVGGSGAEGSEMEQLQDSQ